MLIDESLLRKVATLPQNESVSNTKTPPSVQVFINTTNQKKKFVQYFCEVLVACIDAPLKERGTIMYSSYSQVRIIKEKDFFPPLFFTRSQGVTPSCPMFN